MLFPEAGKCAQKGTTREPQQGLTTRFDRTESDGLCAETPGPAEVYATCLFPISRSARILYMLPAGICGVTYNKKRRQRGRRVQDYDLLIQAPLNSTLTALGKGHTLRGIIVNTEQFRPSEVLLNCIRLEQRICRNQEKLKHEVNGTLGASCQTARQQVAGLI